MERPKIGVGVLIWHHNKLLLLKRKGSHGHGTWSVVGGHLEFGEHFFETAKREAREEANIEINNLQFLCITNNIFEQENKHYITIFIGAHYAGGECQNMETDKCSDIGWFSLDNLPTPLFPTVHDLLNKNCFPADWDTKFLSNHKKSNNSNLIFSPLNFK